MNQPQRFILRATYIERGRLAMLSHLEVARALERTVRRSQLPFAVSQGFSPHMKISFGAALPVGIGSTCEIFDIQLTRYVSAEQALSALQNASVPDLMVTEARYIGADEKAASVAFPVSTYEVEFSGAPGALEVPAEILRRRKNKKDKVLVVSDYLVSGFRFDEANPCCARFSLEARDDGSLRPDLLVEESVRMYNAGSPAEPLAVRGIVRVAQGKSAAR